MDPREGQIPRHQRRIPAPQPGRMATELGQNAQCRALSSCPGGGGPGRDHLRVLLEDLCGREDEAGDGFGDGGGDAVDDGGGEGVGEWEEVLFWGWGGRRGSGEELFDGFVGGEECAGCFIWYK